MPDDLTTVANTQARPATNRESQELPRIRSEFLTPLQGVDHGFFGRKGGVSSGTYASLNAGTGSDDDPAKVAENRNRIAAAMDVPAARLLTPYQVHSAEVEVVSRPFKQDRPRVDALVTRCPSLSLAVLTADCAPVLFADPIARVVAAAHAGWRGAFGGVLENTVEAMVGLGASPSRIVAAIGPCIGAASYEVGDDFVDQFLGQDRDAAQYFQEGPSGSRHFDLKRYCAARLRAAHVSAVDILPQDTYVDEENYFSNRRRFHRGEPDYGRQLSSIRLLAG